MKKYTGKTSLKRVLALGLLLSAFIIHSCKKDYSKTPPKLDEATEQAKSWYESAYPVSSSTSGNLFTQSTGEGFNTNQRIKPDWQHSKKYKRGNKDVIELPIDPETNFNSALRDRATNKIPYDKHNTRSYFLFFNDGKKYTAYIMTVIADATYVKGDTSKLENNTFSHNDPDFTGLVLYFTPKGKYVQGYAYKNGQLVVPQASGHTTKTTQSVPAPNLKPATMITVCIDWYYQTWVNGILISEVYVFTTCETYGDDGDGGSGGTTPPPGCSPPIIEASVSGRHLIVSSTTRVNFVPPPDDPCVEDPSHTKDPDFGEDDPSSCLNCRISSDNFDDFLEYNQSIGNTVYYPYPDTFTYNGVTYPGMTTEIHTATGIQYYFTPNANSGLFQTGVQYHVGETFGSTLPPIVYGPVSYFGPTTGSFSPPAGSGSGGRNTVSGPATNITIADNTTPMSWTNEPDNVILTDPAPTTYAQYQTGTPWPTVSNLVPFSQFVKYYTYYVNGVKYQANCLTLAKTQIAKLGYTCSGYNSGASQFFQTYVTSVNLSRTKQAVTYVISALQAHIPVIAGVDVYAGGFSNPGDGVTDHYITIDGMGTDSKGKFFHFVDNSTDNPSAGDYYNNKLYYNETTGLISGRTYTSYIERANGHDFIVTQIRKSIPKPLPAQ